MARNDPQIALRLPQDLKDWVEEEAKRNGSSQNSEIVRALRERQHRQIWHGDHYEETGNQSVNPSRLVCASPSIDTSSTNSIDQPYAEFARRLKLCREEAGLTQRELARRIGIDHSQVSRYESGTAIPRPGVMIQIGEAVDVHHGFFRSALPKPPVVCA